MKIRNEIKIGIVVLAGIGLAFYGFNFLKGTDIFNKQQQFYAVYDRVDGLTQDNVVQISGFTVGKTNNIRFHPDKPGMIVVGFTITDPVVKIPKNTIARITSLDLLGTKAIALEIGDSPNYLKSGDTLTNAAIELSIGEEVNRQVLPLKLKTEELLGSIDTLVGVVRTILDTNTEEMIDQSFASIKRAIANFEKTSLRIDTLVRTEKHKLSTIFSNVESISTNFRENNEQLTNVIKNFSAISDTLVKADISKTIADANKAIGDMTAIIAKINRGEGTMGMLINNDSLYKNLDQATSQLDILLEDMRVHPKRYVRFSIFGGRDRHKLKLSAREEQKLQKLLQ